MNHSFNSDLEEKLGKAQADILRMQQEHQKELSKAKLDARKEAKREGYEEGYRVGKKYHRQSEAEAKARRREKRKIKDQLRYQAAKQTDVDVLKAMRKWSDYPCSSGNGPIHSYESAKLWLTKEKHQFHEVTLTAHKSAGTGSLWVENVYSLTKPDKGRAKEVLCKDSWKSWAYWDGLRYRAFQVPPPPSYFQKNGVVLVSLEDWLTALDNSYEIDIELAAEECHEKLTELIMKPAELSIENADEYMFAETDASRDQARNLLTELMEEHGLFDHRGQYGPESASDDWDDLRKLWSDDGERMMHREEIQQMLYSAFVAGTEYLHNQLLFKNGAQLSLGKGMEQHDSRVEHTRLFRQEMVARAKRKGMQYGEYLNLMTPKGLKEDLLKHGTAVFGPSLVKVGYEKFRAFVNRERSRNK